MELSYKFDKGDGYLMPYTFIAKDRFVAKALGELYTDDKDKYNYKKTLYKLIYGVCSTNDLEYLTDLYNVETVSEIVDKVMSNVDTRFAKKFEKAKLKDYVLELFKNFDISKIAEKVKDEITDLLYDDAYNAFDEEINGVENDDYDFDD